jgi:hypothetical protein
MRSEIAYLKPWSENMLDLARLMFVARCDYKFDHVSIECGNRKRRVNSSFFS